MIVGIAYTEMNENVRAQIVRDFLALGEPGFYRDMGESAPDSILRMLGWRKTEADPEFYVSYSTGENALEIQTDRPVVSRDLSLKPSQSSVLYESSNPYYLRPQSRNGPNMTEQLLNRTPPRGFGTVPYLT